MSNDILAEAIEPSPEFQEFRRLARLFAEADGISARTLDETDPIAAAASARADDLLKALNAVEARILNRPPRTLSDLLDRAALTLFWSDFFDKDAFDDPVERLNSAAEESDCFNRRALRLTAAIFEMAKGGSDVTI